MKKGRKRMKFHKEAHNPLGGSISSLGSSAQSTQTHLKTNQNFENAPEIEFKKERKKYSLSLSRLTPPHFRNQMPPQN